MDAVQTLLTLAAVALVSGGCTLSSSLPGDAGAACGAKAEIYDPRAWPLLTIEGDVSPMGVFDPSLAVSADGGEVFVSYTSLVSGKSLQTRVASSTDQGQSWRWLTDVNRAAPLTLATTDVSVCGAAMCTGTWVHETSSLVLDPQDPDPSQRVKVFTHAYFVTASGAVRYDIGSIDLHTTSELTTGAAWRQTRLFGWASSSPQSSAGAAFNISSPGVLDGKLSDCLIVSEPGALVRGGTIELALGCVGSRGAERPLSIRLVRSGDHGRSWRFVSTVLDEADARALGAEGPLGPQLNAASLYEAGGALRLLVSPNGPVGNAGGNGYAGCTQLRFSDVALGAIDRCGSEPRVEVALKLPSSGGGACAAHPGVLDGRALVSVPDFTRAAPFRILVSPVRGF